MSTEGRALLVQLAEFSGIRLQESFGLLTSCSKYSLVTNLINLFQGAQELHFRKCCWTFRSVC